MTRVLICFCVLTVATTASAQDSQMVHVGAGASSCGEFLTAVDASARTSSDTLKEAMLMSWAQGYVVGFAEAVAIVVSGAAEPNLPDLRARFHTVSGWVLDPPDGDALKHWVVKYCREHPLDPLKNAASGLVAELLAKKP